MEIGKRDKLNLMIGGLFGVTALYIKSKDIILSVVAGGPLGIGGAAVAIFFVTFVAGGDRPTRDASMLQNLSVRDKTHRSLVLAIASAFSVALMFLMGWHQLEFARLGIAFVILFLVLNHIYDWLSISRTDEPKR